MTPYSLIERFILDDLLLGAGATKISATEPLVSSRILDSLALLRLISFVEDRFSVMIEDEELIPTNFETINTIANLIERKQPKMNGTALRPVNGAVSREGLASY